jgi:D-tyrosyl-tRNA(Tyr) deacylase
MIALLQRVAEAAVLVNKNVAADCGQKASEAITEKNHLVGRIDSGMLALVGVEKGDGTEQADRLLQRMLAWRMFEDQDGRMNLNLSQVDGGLLLVPQFTLAANTNSGNRPSFTSAAPPEDGRRLFDELVLAARKLHPNVETGIFGADMNVSLVNDGPVTFWLQVKPVSG